MNYYITVLSELLTVSRECNSFLSAFRPMAVDSPALADALVSWSSGHLAATNASYRVTALEARSTALHALTETISSAPDDLTCCETNVATCLVLLTSEVCLGDHTGCVTLVAKPLTKAEYLEGIAGLVDTYLGVASEILLFISEISCLEPMELVYEYVDESDDSPFVFLGDRYASLERRIKGWKCQLDTAPTLEAVAYAYRSAALLYLYRRILRALDDGPHRRE
ncbi:hypothetical protein N8T08_006202 [Aspergillus melleus]|uniref:Uncharacterized protein n=1 Tax=Aspergillus melleus TaxID=138277 RepID=A0ACC3AZY9_9EURO|nr:hypothetical protein N8T08_006202 [Aspergillus melleus]